ITSSPSVASPSSSSPPPTISLWMSPVETSLIWNYSKFDKKDLTDELDPYYALDYVYKILSEVVENAIASGAKNFRSVDIKKVAYEVNENLRHFKDLCQHWNNVTQKVQFIDILKKQAHLYVYLLMLIARCNAGKLFFISE